MKYRSFLRGILIIVTTLLLLGGSILILVFVNRSISERRTQEFSVVLDQASLLINRKINGAVDSLYDLRGLFRLGEVDIAKWDDFTKAILEENHQYIDSFAYVERVEREDLPAFEKMMRQSEDLRYTNFVVFPKTEAVVSYPIKYLYTRDDDIKALLGFDFQYSGRTTSAMEASVLSNKPTLSELTHLDLVIPNSKKVGYEVIIPVYDKAELSQNLKGFMGVWINAENLKGDWVNRPGVKYSVYEGSEKIFSTGNLEKDRSLIEVSKEIDLLGRNFRIVLQSDRLYKLDSFEENLPRVTLGAVLLINLLWMLSIYAILSSRRKAVNLAEFVTRDLKKFKQAVDGGSDHLVITDPEGVITYANQAATMTTGYSNKEMMGEKPSLWGGQMPKEFYQKFWKTIKIDKKSFWGEITNKRKTGELYEAEIQVTPIFDEKGELIFFVSRERDLSKQKSIEKMKTEFIALASHQLRTPLSAVKWFSEMLLDGDAGKLTKMQEKYVSKVNESNEREIQIVNALLNVSRIESGKIVVVNKQTNLRDLAESIMSDFKVNMVGEDRRFLYSIDPKIPNINIDPELIKHVYNNLLNNAVNYTPVGGSIDVKVYLKGGKIISEIKDTGIGIPKDERDRIFEKFFRASNALRKYTEGTGLGLYLTKTIIESSGGEIWFASNEGKGTTFTFTLPVRVIKKRNG